MRLYQFCITRRRFKCILSSCLVLLCVTVLLTLCVQFIRHILLQIEIRDIQRIAGRKPLITFRLSKRWGIGNEMFAFASTYGILKSNGGKTLLMCVDGDAFIRNIFDVDSFLTCRADVLVQNLGAARLVENAYAAHDPGMYSLATGRHLVVGHFLQSWRYFTRFEPEIRQIFSFKDSILKTAKETLNEMVDKRFECRGCSRNVMKIGVHVRRGNMAEDPELLDKGYVVADMAYLNRAFSFYDSQFFGNKIFIICSDDIVWCQNNLHNRKDVLFVFTGLPELDLAILSLCNHSIITVGTFGWWAAWLSNGTTVYYKNWPKQGSSLAAQTVHKDYFPPTWIGL